MKQTTHEPRQIELILLDIRSTYNVGAMFRTADAIGVSKIILAGITPAPLDRFGRPRADIAKSALGSEKTMPWESVINIVSRISQLKKKGYKPKGRGDDAIAFLEPGTGQILKIFGTGNGADVVKKNGKQQTNFNEHQKMAYYWAKY